MPTKEQIEAIIIELQKIMRLQDWDIELKYLSATEMFRETNDITTIADCTRSRAHHLATIRLNYEADKTGEVVGGWYRTLVHEMYHIMIDSFDYCVGFEEGNDGVSLAKERLVCDLARTFINIYPVKNFEHILTEA